MSMINHDEMFYLTYFEWNFIRALTVFKFYRNFKFSTKGLEYALETFFF